MSRHVQILLHPQLVSTLALTFECRVYRYYDEDFWCWTQFLAGTLQTVLYLDFLYYYYVAMRDGKPVNYSLPV